MTNNLNPSEYTEQVLNNLETIGYPELILDFNPAQVATSMMATMAIFYAHNQSPMMCALVIYGMTWEMQVVPYAKQIASETGKQ